MSLRKLFNIQQTLTESEFKKIFGTLGTHLWSHFVLKADNNLLNFYNLLDSENGKKFEKYVQSKGVCGSSAKKTLSGIKKTKLPTSILKTVPLSKVVKGDLFKKVGKNGVVGKKVYKKEGKESGKFHYSDSDDYNSQYTTKTDLLVQIGFEY